MSGFKLFIEFMDIQRRQHMDIDQIEEDEFKSANKTNKQLHKILSLIVLVPFIYLLYLNWKTSDFPKTQYLFNITSIRQVNQLPFCLFLVPSQAYKSDELMASIKKQNYTNLRVISDLGSAKNYDDLKKIMQQKCVEYSVIMFINLPLQDNSIRSVNQKFQRQKGWVILTKNQQKVEIIAFFFRIYQLFESNDYNNTNQQYLLKNNREVQALAFLELCQQYKIQIEKKQITKAGELSYFSVDLKNTTQYHRQKYTKLLRLSQDYNTNTSEIQDWKKLRLYKKPLYAGEGIKLIHMRKAFQRQQLIFLPQNHSIGHVQHLQMNRKYQIDKYTSLNNQIRFCVTILNHNNIQNNRYLKVIRSIVQQQYENYHIVFIDDVSSDETVKKTIQYFEKMKFPKNRLQFVQNIQRNYATYNIINAAFNFCGDDDVQMLIDGDDEFIGKYAFQVMNSAYQQKRDVWIAYSNYKTNLFIYGISRPYKSRHSHANGKKRVSGTFIGPIRTWRVKLVRSIPKEHHQMKNGKWLDSCYDDAIAHPLVELAGFERTAYIPEIFYEYNTFYGDNDDATQERVMHRLEIYAHILTIPVLDQLKSLAETKKDPVIEKELNADWNKKFKLLQI